MTRRDEDTPPLGGAVAGYTVLGLVLILGIAWMAMFVYAGDRAPRTARVEGVDISHLDPAAAEGRLRDALDVRAKAPIEVSYGDGRMRAVDPVAAGLTVDYHQSVVAAGGGSGWSVRRLWQVASGGGNHEAVVDIDERKLDAALDALGEGIATPPVNGTVVFHDGRAVGVPGQPGEVVDRTAAREMLVDRFLHQGSQKLPTRTEAPAITGDEVNEVIGTFGRSAMSGPVTLVVAGQRVVAPPRLFERALSMTVEGGHLVPQVDGDLLMKALAPIMPAVSSEPVDARIVLRSGHPVVVPARLGVTVDDSRLEPAFAAALTRQGPARRIAVPATVRQPALTTAAARSLGVSTLVSSATVRFTDVSQGRVLSRTAAVVDGTLLRPRQTFSLNDVLGTPSTADEAATATGNGGAAAAAATNTLATGLFDAMFFAGLQDQAHTAPAVHSAGAPAGLEAAVVWPTSDLRFTDDTPYGVLVTTAVRRARPGHPGSLTVSMWSTKSWDVTARTGPRTGLQQPSVRDVQATVCRAVTGSPGFGVDVQRVFRRPGSGKVVRTETFHTDYQAGETIRCPQAKNPRHS